MKYITRVSKNVDMNYDIKTLKSQVLNMFQIEVNKLYHIFIGNIVILKNIKSEYYKHITTFKFHQKH